MHSLRIEAHSVAQQSIGLGADSSPGAGSLGSLAADLADLFEITDRRAIVVVGGVSSSAPNHVVDREGVEQLGKLGPGQFFAAKELRSHGPAAVDKNETHGAIR